MKLFRFAAGVSATFVFCAVAFAATPKAGHYRGTTSAKSDRALTFKVSSNGKKVTALTAGYAVICPSGAHVGEDGAVVSGSFAIHGGHFSGTAALDRDGKATVTGKFTSSKTASGTLRLQPYNDNEDGEEGGTVPPETCDTGTLKWTAHRG